MTSLVNRVLKGTVWAYASLFSSKLIVFLANAWLVRLLSPQEFGLRHMALVVIGIFEMLQGLGVNEALIYTTEDVEKATENVFLINIGLGAFFSAITISIGLWAAPYINETGAVAQWLGTDNLADIKTALSLLPIMGLSFFILSLGKTHDTLLRKSMKFKTKFWPDIISAIVRSAVAIVLALQGYGVLSLVYSYIVGCVIRSISIWVIVPYRPKFRYYRETSSLIWRYGGGLTVFKLLDTGFSKFDQIVIGAGLGSASLGFYGEAQRIPDLLIMNLNVVLTRVLFPAYSGIKDNLQALKQSYAAATKYMTLLVMPIALGLAMIAPYFVSLYFGPGWELVTPLLQWLSLTMLWLTMAWNVGDLIKALGRPGLLTRLLFIEAAVNLPLLLGGAYLDIQGVTGHPALGATIGSSMGFLFGSFIRLGMVSRLLDFTFREILGLFYEALLSGGVMLLGLIGLNYLLPGMPSLVAILGNFAVGALLYLGMLWLVARQTIRDAWNVLTDFLKTRGKGNGEDGK